MHFSYRGVPYEAQGVEAKVVETRQVVTFRGCQYRFRQADMASHSGIPVVLTYRGVSYLVEKA
ncbi:MAG: DUF4278 domain-containing protein [Elainella sp.]